MNAHALLTFLNNVRKSDKMRGLLSISQVVRNKLNKFNNTGAGMFNPNYHMTLILL